jgi:D-lyxose ketol-isomerase
MDEPKQTYYAKNRERQLALAKAYRDANKEKMKGYWKKYYQENKHTLKDKHREYVRKNRDVINRKNRTIYYPKHQAKKKEESPPEVPVDLNPTVEMPMWTMIVSPGNHCVSFE